MQLTRVMAPEPEDSTPSLTRLLTETVARLFAFLDFHMIPAAPKIADVIDLTHAFEPGKPESYTDGPTMAQIYKAQLVKHIRRVEHVLRCMLFLLATKLISDPETRARLTAREPVLRAPPQRRPYDMDMLVQITKPEPRSSFVSLSHAPTGKTYRSKRRFRHTPLDWKEVEISGLIARMEQFPKVLKSLDRRAENLAARLLSGEIAMTEHEVKGPRISGPGFEHLSKRPKHHPVFLRHLSHWLPPPELYGDCHDDDRSTYNKLHSLAFEAASACVDF